MIRVLLICLFLKLSTIIDGQIIPIDSVKFYFDSFRLICQKDEGKMWNINFFSPIILYDVKTHTIFTNFKDKYGILSNKYGIYSGTLPDTLNINEFENVSWIFNWPLPGQNEFERISNIIHEVFHHYQDSLKLSPLEYNNNHIDSLNARISLIMEWSALKNALKLKEQSLKYVKLALIWRSYRRSLFPNKILDENRFEVHEGLAEYTGIKLTCDALNLNPEICFLELYDLKMSKKQNIENTFVRSFGYFSGAFYALLLDRYYPNWRINFEPNSDLGKMLSESLNIQMPLNITDSINKFKDDQYGIIQKEEIKREKILKRKNIVLLKKFYKHPVLIIKKTEKFMFSFNVNTMQVLGKNIIYFPYMNASDTWGDLKIKKNGVIIDTISIKIPIKKLRVNGNKINSCDDWALEVNKDWQLIKIHKDYYLIKK